MLYIRKGQDRGHSRYSWLNSFHTFSFANYYDPGFMGYGSLRVINEDTVQPGYGFEAHPHHNMEIISYVVDGLLEHKDSMGTGSVIKPGEIQIMSAGTGVEHSEFNHSKKDSLHFLQIWIIPSKPGLQPSYQQKTIQQSKNSFILIGSNEPQDNAVIINQDVKLYAAYLTPENAIHYTFENKRRGWLQLVKGKIKLNGVSLSTGDGAVIQDEKNITIECVEDAELLLFDLA
jgi:redox-sensitive bicupin YhaK (pirin superfamily)